MPELWTWPELVGMLHVQLLPSFLKKGVVVASGEGNVYLKLWVISSSDILTCSMISRDHPASISPTGCTHPSGSWEGYTVHTPPAHTHLAATSASGGCWHANNITTLAQLSRDTRGPNTTWPVIVQDHVYGWSGLRTTATTLPLIKNTSHWGDKHTYPYQTKPSSD